MADDKAEVAESGNTNYDKLEKQFQEVRARSVVTACCHKTLAGLHFTELVAVHRGQRSALLGSQTCCVTQGARAAGAARVGGRQAAAALSCGV